MAVLHNTRGKSNLHQRYFLPLILTTSRSIDLPVSHKSREYPIVAQPGRNFRITQPGEVKHAEKVALGD